jgi:hypothetical protein
MAHASTPKVWLRRIIAAEVVLPLAGALLATATQAVRAVDPPKTALAAPATGGGNVAEVVKMIDEKLETSWKENKLTPSKQADDYEFIRRASLDIIGRIATHDEIIKFEKDPKETRRALLVDRLLQSEEYAKNWANLWSNWLLTRSGLFTRSNYHDSMILWLEDQFATNRPYHEFVKDLVTAKGKNIGKDSNGATNFILAHLGEPVAQKDQAEEGHFQMVPITARITRLFLGVQTQCTQCHDHPFDAKLKQKDFWGVNVFLRQVERKGTPPNMRQMAAGMALELEDNPSLNKNGLISYEKRNGVFMVTKPVFLGGASINVTKVKNRREELAGLLIEHENFPKAMVNRMWAHFFGKGLSNPVDDFTEQSQCAYPELLDDLGKEFKHYGYNQKDLIRWICNSKAYNLSSVANKTNDKPEAEVLFSRMLLKSMSPEQLYESLFIATSDGTVTKDAKKDQREKWLNALITNFGDDEGNETNFNGTVVQALMMMNGQEINDAINKGGSGPVAKVLRKGATPRTMINDLYLAGLNRPATDREITKIQNAFKDSKIRDAAVATQLQDLYWALLNSNEFLLNH